MNSAPGWPVPDDWTPEQALAAYDLISVIREIIWQQYEDPLLTIMIDEDKQRFTEQQYRLNLDETEGN